MDLHTLGREELAQHQHGAALPPRQQKETSWAIQPEGKFHASIAEYPTAVQFSPRPAPIHTNNQYNGHIFVSPKFSLGKWCPRVDGKNVTVLTSAQAGAISAQLFHCRLRAKDK